MTFWLPGGDSDGDVGKRDAGPLPRCTPVRLRDQHAPSGPKGLRQNRPSGRHSLTARTVPLAMACVGVQWVERGPVLGERAHSSAKLPSPSLRSVSIPAALCSASSSRVQEKLRYRVESMRPMSTRIAKIEEREGNAAPVRCRGFPPLWKKSNRSVCCKVPHEGYVCGVAMASITRHSATRP
jgi:hypothetical protein